MEREDNNIGEPIEHAVIRVALFCLIKVLFAIFQNNLMPYLALFSLMNLLVILIGGIMYKKKNLLFIGTLDLIIENIAIIVVFVFYCYSDDATKFNQKDSFCWFLSVFCFLFNFYFVKVNYSVYKRVYLESGDDVYDTLNNET